MCKEAKKDSKGNLKKAAAKIIAELHWMDIRKTPDGYTYTPLNVRLAIRD
jgi:hypothetical protein